MNELSPEAKALLRRARGEFSPGEGRLKAVRSALDAQIAPSGGEATSTRGATSSMGARAAGIAGWTAGKTVGAALIVAALGASGAALWRSHGSRSAASRVILPTENAPPKAPTPTSPLPNARSEGALAQAPETATGPGAAAPPAVTALEAPGTPSARDRAGDAHASPGARSGVKGRSKGETSRESAIATTSSLALAASAPLSPPLASPTAPTPGPTAAAAPADSLAEEVRLLRDAHAALDGGDASHALGVLAVHEARFPRGTLYEERLATRVQALCTLGRADAARLTARELERAAPRSPHLTRVRTSCVAAPSRDPLP